MNLFKPLEDKIYNFLISEAETLHSEEIEIRKMIRTCIILTILISILQITKVLFDLLKIEHLIFTISLGIIGIIIALNGIYRIIKLIQNYKKE